MALIPPSSNAGDDGFAATRWSLVLQAVADRSSDRAPAALEALCRGYWFPLYAYVRRHGHSGEEAQDLTQEFFSRFLEKGGLAGADPAKGRFRAYLLGAMKHFLANQARAARAQKRGGGQQPFSLDAIEAEQRYAMEGADLATPEALYERRWAEALVARVMAELAAGFQHPAVTFDEVKGWLAGESGGPSYEHLASSRGTTAQALRSLLHKLRRRYRELFRAEIERTVAHPSEVEEEIRHLFAVLGT